MNFKNESEKEIKSDEILQDKSVSKKNIDEERKQKTALNLIFVQFFMMIFLLILTAGILSIKETIIVKHEFIENSEIFVYEFDEQSNCYDLVSGTSSLKKIVVYFNADGLEMTIVDLDTVETISLDKRDDYYICNSYNKRFLVKTYDKLLFVIFEAI